MENEINPIEVRVADALSTNLKKNLGGSYEDLLGTPGTQEVSQLNAHNLKGDPTGKEVEQAIMSAMSESGVYVMKSISPIVDDNRCQLMLVLGDTENVVNVTASYAKELNKLRITVHSATKNTDPSVLQETKKTHSSALHQAV